MAEPNKDKIRQYYETAWKQVYEELRTQLLTFGFAPKSPDGKFEIGNKHGQVYAYTIEMTKINNTLFSLMINPTQTGKSSIKLTFQDSNKYMAVAEQIKSTLSAKILGKSLTTKDGRFVVEYFFYTDPLPTDPCEAGSILLETANQWLKTITSTAR